MAPEGFRSRRRLTDDEGTTLVEFAFSASVFLALLVIIMQFGALIWRYNMLADLAQEGARYAIVRGSSNTSSCASFSSTGCKASSTNVKDYVVSRSNGMITATNVTADTPSGLNPGATVSVQVSKSYVIGVPYITGGNGTFALTATSKMIMQY
jgi:Flp pilus assembly protein TadG